MKLSEAIKSIDKATNAKVLDDSEFSKITGYIDTGSFAINRILTGDIHKGFVQGRITTLYGQSGSGKSLFTAQAVVNAIRNNQVDIVYLFDSEGGMLRDFYMKSLTQDERQKIRHQIVSSIEDASVQILKTYDFLEKAHMEFIDDPDNNDDVRALCVLDSLGALKSEKFLKDAINKDTNVQDMGLTAKLKNNLMSILMPKVVLSNATLLVVNWEYDDPSAFLPSKVKKMGGGKGIEKASHVILQCEKLAVKSSDTDHLTGNESETDEHGFYKGNNMKFFVTKNRICKPFFEARAYMDFSGGISKYDGLIDDAVKFGFLQEVRGGYICPSYSDKRITYKDIVANDDVWNTFIEDFNKKSIEVMSYSNSTSRELDELDNEELNKEND